MRLLAIDTSGTACSVALLENGAVVAERHEDIGRGHAEALVPWIAGLPAGGRADRIIVGCGPGSFTGVRVGIAAAKGLALAWDVPVTGVSSFALIASEAYEEAFLIVTEAGHGELFVQSFAREPLRETGPLASRKPDDTGETIPLLPAYGNGAGRLFASGGCQNARDATARAANVRFIPDALTQLAPSPIYGRAPDARPMT